MRRAMFIIVGVWLVLAGLAFLAQYQNYKRAKQDVSELRKREAAKGPSGTQ